MSIHAHHRPDDPKSLASGDNLAEWYAQHHQCPVCDPAVAFYESLDLIGTDATCNCCSVSPALTQAQYAQDEFSWLHNEALQRHGRTATDKLLHADVMSPDYIARLFHQWLDTVEVTIDYGLIIQLPLQPYWQELDL